MPEEVRFFLRQAGFGLAVTVVYWFISYEVAGTIMLLAFGLGSALLTLVLALETRRGPSGRRWGGPWQWLALTPADAASPTLEQEARLPAPGLAPFQVGLGVATAGLAAVFGPWFLVVGAVPLAVGAWGWIRSAMAEHRALEAGEGSAASDAPDAR